MNDSEKLEEICQIVMEVGGPEGSSLAVVLSKILEITEEDMQEFWDDEADEATPWALGNGEELHANNPDSFYIPEESERTSLQPGNLAKLVFKTEDGGERMWVEVQEVSNGNFIGLLINNPICIWGLGYGDPVVFEPKHVIDVVIQ